MRAREDNSSNSRDDAFMRSVSFPTFSVNVQYFSLTANQPTFSHQPSEQGCFAGAGAGTRDGGEDKAGPTGRTHGGGGPGGSMARPLSGLPRDRLGSVLSKQKKK